MQKLLCGAVLATALLFPVVIQNQYILLVAALTWVYAMGGLAWNLLGGYAGQLSLGHAIYFGTGVYTSALLFLRLGLTPWIGMFAGASLAMLVAMAIGWVCFRLRGPFYVMASIGFLQVFETLAIKLKGLTNGPLGLSVASSDPNWVNFQFFRYEGFYYTGLVLTAAMLAFTYAVDRGRVGYYLRAVRENEDVAEAIGINTVRQKVVASAASGFFTGLAGAYYAQLTGYIDPTVVYGFAISMQFMLVAFIGGAGTPLGPLVGALILTPVAELLRTRYGMVPGLHLFVYGVSIIVVALWLRRGLLPAGERLWTRWVAPRLARGAG